MKYKFFNQTIEFHGAEAFFFGIMVGIAVFHAFALGVVGIIDLIYGA